MADNGWKRPFEDPIPLPEGRRLITLQDAGAYITRLTKAEQQLDEWHTAVEALLVVVQQNGPTMFARIAVMKALNRHVERVFNPDRKDTPLGQTEAQEGPMSGLSSSNAGALMKQKPGGLKRRAECQYI